MFVIDKQKLYMLCAEKCIPVTQALKNAGCSVAVLHSICTGKKIQVATLGKLAKTLGCNPAELIAG